jgi:hypothetical protein
MYCACWDGPALVAFMRTQIAERYRILRASGLYLGNGLWLRRAALSFLESINRFIFEQYCVIARVLFFYPSRRSS